jgi:hypothetical protein
VSLGFTIEVFTDFFLFVFHCFSAYSKHNLHTTSSWVPQGDFQIFSDQAVSIIDTMDSPSHQNTRIRTRRDTATATSRFVVNVTRSMNSKPRLDARPR